jgi:NAD(P)-dependent dehydrogenase (short-subunit alcohol dehydrogenase family)
MSKTIVITGASDGIGAEAARALASAGHHVVIVGRSPQKTRAVAVETGADSYTTDFADLAQVRQLADNLNARYPRIDVLANNAGGIFNTHTVTVDGHDTTFQVNHLAPFLLTNLLLGTLQNSHATVIQTASQVAKRHGHLNIDDLDNQASYQPIKAYSDAKLENILFTKELHRRYAHAGISAVAFHPGNVASNFASDTTTAWRFIYQTPLRHLALMTPRKAAEPLIWLAQGQPGHGWQPGEYYEKRKIAATNPQASDSALSTQLWERSAQMAGLPDTSQAR